MIDNYVINENPITIKRALISVFDKNGIEEFAKFLSEKNIEIVSTGGTSALLKKAQIPIVEINDFTLINYTLLIGEIGLTCASILTIYTGYIYFKDNLKSF